MTVIHIHHRSQLLVHQLDNCRGVTYQTLHLVVHLAHPVVLVPPHRTPHQPRPRLDHLVTLPPEREQDGRYETILEQAGVRDVASAATTSATTTTAAAAAMGSTGFLCRSTPTSISAAVSVSTTTATTTTQPAAPAAR